MDATEGQDRLGLVTRIAVAWLNNPDHTITPGEVPRLLLAIGQALKEPVRPAVTAPPAPAVYARAVSVERSLASRDYILSMINGKPYRGLVRHIVAHGLTPDEYRARYRLPRDYPMVPPSYSAQRREFAKKMGLGHLRKRRDLTS